jgi:hypothetical protein
MMGMHELQSHVSLFMRCKSSMTADLINPWVEREK